MSVLNFNKNHILIEENVLPTFTFILVKGVVSVGKKKLTAGQVFGFDLYC